MENIRLEDFIKYKFLSGIKFSPNGRYACFAVHNAELEDNQYSSNLWLYDKEKNSYSQLTALNKEKGYIWLNDSQHILFSTIRNPKDKEKKDGGEEFTQYYRLNIHRGEALPYFRIPRNVGSIKEIDSNTYLFTSPFNSNKKDLNLLEDKDKAEELKARKEEKDYEVLDEIPFWSNGGGFTNKDRNRLYIYSLDTGTMEALTDELTDVGSVNLNKDNTKIVFTASCYKDKMELYNNIYVYDIAAKTTEQITPVDKFSYSNAYFITDRDIICTGKAMQNYGINENGKFHIVNIDTKERKCITPEFDFSTNNSVGTDCRYGTSPSMIVKEGYLYFITTEYDSAHLNRVDIEGNIDKVIGQTGTVDEFSIAEDEILFIGFRDMKIQELYSFKEGKEKQITQFNQWLQQERKIVGAEKLRVESEPGVIIDGWVMKPADFDPNKKYPAILDIHGGPKTVYGPIFYHEMQYWANEGYFVFFCNPRGSDGKGNAFADIRAKYGTIDYHDIMKFTDAVLDKYTNIDAERVGVTGGSYGGFMTNWIIGHTHRFRAAASQRSISNWVSKFCTTDIGYYFVHDQNGTTPWGNQQQLWDQSPLKYADKVKTPTLFIHSEEDYRCWLVEGIQMFTALKYHGVESRMCMFRGENHELSRSGKPKHRIRRLTEITRWFDKYLK